MHNPTCWFYLYNWKLWISEIKNPLRENPFVCAISLPLDVDSTTKTATKHSVSNKKYSQRKYKLLLLPLTDVLGQRPLGLIFGLKAHVLGKKAQVFVCKW